MTGYGADTTTGEVLEDHNLAGRHFMITGASSGLGEESARALSQAGATVTILARNLEKLEAAKERIQGSVPSADLRIGIVDLADLTSIRAYAENFLAKGKAIDYEGATAVKFTDVGEHVGNFIEKEIKGGKFKNKKQR